MNVNSFPLERGKTNLNFELSYIKFTLRVEKILRKNDKFHFQKNVIFDKKTGIKFKFIKTLYKTQFFIYKSYNSTLTKQNLLIHRIKFLFIWKTVSTSGNAFLSHQNHILSL